MIAAPRADLLKILQAGLHAVDGHQACAQFLSRQAISGPIYPVAIGKAASAMMNGLLQVMSDQVVSGLLITKHGHSEGMDSRIQILESSHPIPQQDSLEAGAHLLEFIAGLPAQARLVFLISGGASSLLEVLAEGLLLEDLIRVNTWLLSSGMDITQMNRVRCAMSQIKGGGLLRFLGERPAQVLLISDVIGDDPATIGSGLLCPIDETPLDDAALPAWLEALLQHAIAPPFFPQGDVVRHFLVADNRQAQVAAGHCAGELGYPVRMADELFSGPATEVAQRFVKELLQGPEGVTIWGGESTVVLPESPGQGGRNQHLALQAAIALSGQANVFVLAIGTDGSDGPGQDAGALVDAGSVERGEACGLDARACLREADSGRFLAASGDLINTGPTGTNVVDLLIGLKLSNDVV